ncbi:MAG: hypothetical protein ACLP2Y_08920 [Limisphaerales bacterium]
MSETTTPKPEIIPPHKSRPNLVLPAPIASAAPVVAPAPVATPIDDRPDKEPLPSNFMLCFPILERLRQIGAQVMTRPEKAAVHARIKKVREHIFALQQGLPVVDIDQNQARVERARHIGSAEVKRNERLAQLKDAIDRNVWLPIYPERTLAEPLVNFLAEPEAVSIIVSLRRALAAYEIGLLKNFNLLNPRQRQAEFKIALNSRPSDELVQTIREESVLFASEHYSAIRSHKAAELQERFDTTVKPRLKLFLNSGLLHVTEQKLAAIVAEAEFFETNGNAPWHETAASKRFDPTLAELKHALASLTNPRPVAYAATGHTLPSAETALQTIFALSVLPELVE